MILDLKKRPSAQLYWKKDKYEYSRLSALYRQTAETEKERAADLEEAADYCEEVIFRLSAFENNCILFPLRNEDTRLVKSQQTVSCAHGTKSPDKKSKDEDLWRCSFLFSP